MHRGFAILHVRPAFIGGSLLVEDPVENSLAVDAKRILLRYGAPIVALDNVPDKERIALARTIAKTPLPERETRLAKLMEDAGYVQSAE